MISAMYTVQPFSGPATTPTSHTVVQQMINQAFYYSHSQLPDDYRRSALYFTDETFLGEHYGIYEKGEYISLIQITISLAHKLYSNSIMITRIQSHEHLNVSLHRFRDQRYAFDYGFDRVRHDKTMSQFTLLELYCQPE